VELVFGDRPLVLDREGASLEGRSVGVLLHQLAGGGAERLLDVGLGADRSHPNGHECEPDVGEALIGR
jgi:hypothetical protein